MGQTTPTPRTSPPHGRPPHHGKPVRPAREKTLSHSSGWAGTTTDIDHGRFEPGAIFDDRYRIVGHALDRSGRIRITDFGLAGATGEILRAGLCGGRATVGRILD